MIAVLLFIWSMAVPQPDTVTLADCYQQLEEQYPLTDKYALQQQITDAKLKNMHTRYYPQLEWTARGSYQSHVTEITFTPPNVPAPQFDKDQYSTELQASQLIYGGGQIEARKEQVRQQGQLEQSRVDVSMHEVRKMIDRIYFNILRMEKNQASLQWTLKKIEAQRALVQSQVKHGVLLSSNLKVLEAEKTKLEQQLISLKHDRQAAYAMLAKLLDVNLDTSVVLQPPVAGHVEKNALNFTNRAEYELFQNQHELLAAQIDAIEAEKGPQVSAFATAGYGRPGLNRFDPDFQPYYIVGLQVQWSFWDLLNAGREKEQLTLLQKQVEADRKAFSRQLNSSVQQYTEEIKKFDQLIEKDRHIIEQRNEIVEQSESQLENGVITSSDYLEELYEAKRARLQLELHEIERSYARIQLLTQMNESWN